VRAPRFLDVSGRIGRGGFFQGWLPILVACVLLWVVVRITVAAGAGDELSTARREVLHWALPAISVLVSPFVYRLCARRFNDLDWPAWLALIPAAGAIADAVEGWFTSADGAATVVLQSLAGVVEVASLILVLGGVFLPGVPGLNRRGEPNPAAQPRAPGALTPPA
jgi:uncharacterized membrane protein YhaH (DUF805 family)